MTRECRQKKTPLGQIGGFGASGSPESGGVAHRGMAPAIVPQNNIRTDRRLWSLRIAGVGRRHASRDGAGHRPPSPPRPRSIDRGDSGPRVPRTASVAAPRGAGLPVRWAGWSGWTSPPRPVGRGRADAEPAMAGRGRGGPGEEAGARRPWGIHRQPGAVKMGRAAGGQAGLDAARPRAGDRPVAAFLGTRGPPRASNHDDVAVLRRSQPRGSLSGRPD
jgi:hypothetical protein